MACVLQKRALTGLFLFFVEASMRRSALQIVTALLLAALGSLAGCNTDKNCQTTTECGGGQVCANQKCQALSCDQTYSAIDPSDGSCRPLPACGNRDDVRTWVSCTDPCAALDEFACIGDKRCQPVYSSDDTGSCAELQSGGDHINLDTPTEGC